ncbi:MAG: hypothetical protein V1790_17560 [Planctomycetota bacterium]
MFKVQTQKLLSGGLHLTQPTDLIPPDGAQCAKNWRADTVGNLRSREGMSRVMSSLDAFIHTLILVSGEGIGSKWRYVGAGNRLFQAGASDAMAEIKRDAWSGDPVEFSGFPFGAVSYDGWLWIVDNIKQGRDDGSLGGAYALPGALGSFYPWLPSTTFILAAGPFYAYGTPAAGTLGGTVTYYATFDTAEGKESNPMGPTPEIIDPVNPFSATLMNIPISLNREVDKRHIYRSGGMLPAPYRVHTISDNTTTTWVDDGTVTDSIAIEQGDLLEEDHDPPPPAQILAGPYNNRLIAACSFLHPNRIWWTPATMPWYFRGSNSDFEGDWADVGELNEEVVAISLHPRMIVIYKENSIWRLVGDLDDGTLEQTNSDTGLIGRRAWASYGGADYFQGREGLYRFDGDHSTKITERVDPIFKGWQSGTGVVNPVRSADPEEKRWACMAIKHGRLYFSYKEQGGENVTLVVNV